MTHRVEPPGRVRLWAGLIGMSLAALWVMGCALGSLDLVLGDRPARGQAVTTGTVVATGHFQQWGRGGLNDHYRPVIAYTVDGADLEVTSEQTRPEPVLGSHVTVIYDVGTPGRATIAPTTGDRWAGVVLVGVGVWFGAWSYLAHVRPARRALTDRSA